jgi:hypothetical protein
MRVAGEGGRQLHDLLSLLPTQGVAGGRERQCLHVLLLLVRLSVILPRARSARQGGRVDEFPLPVHHGRGASCRGGVVVRPSFGNVHHGKGEHDLKGDAAGFPLQPVLHGRQAVRG